VLAPGEHPDEAPEHPAEPVMRLGRHGGRTRTRAAARNRSQFAVIAIEPAPAGDRPGRQAGRPAGGTPQRPALEGELGAAGIAAEMAKSTPSRRSALGSRRHCPNVELRRIHR
jgi:hypothetical protein